MSLFRSLAAASILLAVPAAASHHKSANLVEQAVASPQHTTLVAAVQAADLAGTLASPGPFTVFAPTNAAFEKLPDGTVQTLLRPENKAKLQSVLTYHVVAGRVTAAELVESIRSNNGAAMLKTVEGGTLTARLHGQNVTLTDERGGTARVVMADLAASNGVIHVTDAVSLPN